MSKYRRGFNEGNCAMYLDTDIILALIKKEDWLKSHVNLSKLQPARTSVFTLIEARIILEREYSRKEALRVLPVVSKLGITLVPFEEAVLRKSLELSEKYPQLNTFDSVQVAFAMVHDEILISTDTLFPKIEGLKVKDPRDL